MAIFFGIAGGLTSVGPIAGGYLTEWTWRAIFWVNIPVAIIALVLIAISKPENDKHPAPIDYRGTVLIAAGMGIAVLGLQQASEWGWGSAATIGCLVVRAGDPRPLRPLRAAHPRAAAADADLRGPPLRDAERRPLPADDLLRPAVLLRQHLRPDLARRQRLERRPLPAHLLRRVRDRGAARRPDPRRARRQAGGRARLGDLRGRLLPLGPQAPRPQLRRPVALHRDRRGRGRPGAGARRTPTRSTALRAAATARPPGSPRRSATSARASAWRCWGRSSSSRTSRTSSRPWEASACRRRSPTRSPIHSVRPAGGGLAERGGKRAEEFLHAVQHSYALSSRTIFYAMAGVMAVCFVVSLIALPGGKMEVSRGARPRRLAPAGRWVPSRCSRSSRWCGSVRG